jgi:hypothetical protein
MGYAASTNSMTPHIKEEKLHKKKYKPPAADFHLKDGRKEKE